MLDASLVESKDWSDLLIGQAGPSGNLSFSKQDKVLETLWRDGICACPKRLEKARLAYKMPVPLSIMLADTELRAQYEMNPAW
jgi:hypothetical protein